MSRLHEAQSSQYWPQSWTGTRQFLARFKLNVPPPKKATFLSLRGLLYKCRSQCFPKEAASCITAILVHSCRLTSVLHTWGSTLTHHPHVHMIVPGGGIALDGSRWVSCRSRFFLPWRVLAKLFRRLMLEKLFAAHAAGQLQFFGQHRHLAEPAALPLS